MEDVTTWGLKQLKEQKIAVASIISDRFKVENTLGCDHEYRAETRKYQAHLTQIIKAIDIRYDEITQVNRIGYEFFEDIIQREKDKLIVDEDGVEVVEKFKTLVPPFDDVLLDGGFNYSSFIVIGGESNSGKSDIVFMMIRGALKQGLKVHLHNYETGNAGLFNSLYMKDKLKIDFDNAINKGLFSVDQLAKELTELKQMINIRADEGCRIFVLDSTTKIRINGAMATKPELIDDVFETLRELAHSRGLIIIGIGQKDKESKKTNDNELFGSVMQNHILDYLFFINYENREVQVTTQREIVMIKNRGQDVKKSIVTDYDAENHSLFYVRSGSALGEQKNKIDAWASRIKK